MNNKEKIKPSKIEVTPELVEKARGLFIEKLENEFTKPTYFQTPGEEENLMIEKLRNGEKIKITIGTWVHDELVDVVFGELGIRDSDVLNKIGNEIFEQW